MTETGPGIKTRITSFLIQCKRVWMILKKPTAQEFKSIAKVSAIGLLIIGLMGFIISDLIKIITGS
ncbi:MAG: protein translocase SEC61 complex subunit gamma [Nanoarchaeota archaeon]|nr:protein translocase SEC61 complex subunit gamma [Nanoarchaeota archaeon]